ncbi:MAG: hypothetical protein JWM80_311 [Cyanobacteria bacterium RYN_339]|nr:hypothetical protein [Cyanobacteria bacterium RYN_339]
MLIQAVLPARLPVAAKPLTCHPLPTGQRAPVLHVGDHRHPGHIRCHIGDAPVDLDNLHVPMGCDGTSATTLGGNRRQ